MPWAVYAIRSPSAANVIESNELAMPDHVVSGPVKACACACVVCTPPRNTQLLT